MKRINVTITATLWVPEDRYSAPGHLNVLAGHLRDQVQKPLNEWGSQPEMAVSGLLVNVEVQE